MKRFDHGYALLIAVNESAASGVALPDVIKDATALRDVLVHRDRCAYAPNNVKLLHGKSCTRKGITQGLDWLREKLNADKSGEATALIYFTGHGHTEGGKYWLIPYDFNRDRIKTSALRAEDFADDVAALQPRRLLAVFDCCHAAGMGVKNLPVDAPFHRAGVPPALFMRGETPIKKGAGAKALNALARGDGRAVLNSCRATEQSWIRKDRSMSIFTYHLIEALTGHAQPQNGAREVLVSDIISYVDRRVPPSAQSDWQAEQHPWCESSGTFPVALLLGGKGLHAGERAPDPLAVLVGQGVVTTQYYANQIGDGATAQGENAKAAAKRAVLIGGNHSGDINTGSQVFISRPRRKRN